MARGDEVRVVGFEPLGVAVPGEEVGVCEDSGQEVQVGLDSRDGCVLNGTAGFADYVVPSTSCYDDLRNDAVKVRANAGRDAMHERRVDTDSVTRREVEGLDLADAERVVLLWIFCGDTELD